MSQELLEFKAASGTYNIDEMQGIVECFVAGIGNRDSVGDIVVPGAFNESLKRRKPRVVWGHDWNAPIGKVLDIYEVGPTDPRLPAKMRQAGIGGLYARVQFNLKSERGREAFNSVLFFGEEQEWSIGYKTLDSIYSQERQANILKTLELYEVSPVLHGANQLTATVSIKSEQQEEKLDSFRKSKWKTFDPAFAEMIRSKYPEIWKLGGNIKGNDQYRALKPVLDRGGKATSQAEINALELREAWVARHHQDHLPAGVMAQIKWFAVGSRGEAYMKGVIREEIAKRALDEKSLNEFDALMEDGDVEEKASAPDGPCWPGYEMIGMKPGKGGKMVPNCVPIAGEKAAPSASDLTSLTDAVGLDPLPQERVTGDVMRGYGPRRGNLERLLRYWRPIMRREGGFRRCRVILANHPELYPLENICAWLHHETTGLWPNEGCHHPGMKNCRRKLRNVTRGSLWSDEEFDNRLRNRFKKDASVDLADYAPAERDFIEAMKEIVAKHGRLADGDDSGIYVGYTAPAENEVAYMGIKCENCAFYKGNGQCGIVAMPVEPGGKCRLAAIDYDSVQQDEEDDDYLLSQFDAALRSFIKEEPEFLTYLMNNKNWMHVGDSEDGSEMEHECGNMGLPIEDGDEEMKGWGYMAEASPGVAGRQAGQMPQIPMGRRLRRRDSGDCGCGCGGAGKSADLTDIEFKAGRVISASNMTKLRQALTMLQEVLASGGDEIQMKEMTVPALADEIKSLIEPIAEWYGIEASVSDFGVKIANFDSLSLEAKSALDNALDHVSGDNAFIIIDTEPENMMALKSLIDEYSPDAVVVIDENEGEWLAVQAKTKEFIDGLTKRLSWSGIQVKGYGMGELEFDCGCNS